MDRRSTSMFFMFNIELSRCCVWVDVQIHLHRFSIIPLYLYSDSLSLGNALHKNIKNRILFIYFLFESISLDFFQFSHRIRFDFLFLVSFSGLKENRMNFRCWMDFYYVYYLSVGSILAHLMHYIQNNEK